MKISFKFINLLTVTLLMTSLALQNVAPVKASAPDQTITIQTGAPATAADGESFSVAATSDSGLDVSYSATGVCTNVGATFTMTSAIGTCTVQYDQAGDGTYNPAPQLTENVTATATPTATETATPTETESATVTATSTTAATVTATASPTTTAADAGPGRFVSLQGNDQGGTNLCTSSTTPCRTIQQAILNASPGNTIFVTGAVFHGIDDLPIVTINKSVILSGGWNSTFNAQTGYTILDGQDTRPDMVVNAGFTGIIKNLAITNSSVVGVQNNGTLNILSSLIYNNNKPDGTETNGGGIYNTGTLVIVNSAIFGNHADGGSGGGIYNAGSLTVKNSTIANNHAINGGGIMYTPAGYVNTAPSIILSGVTISGNSADYGGSIYHASDMPPVLLQEPILYNSIVANNGNCEGTITSANNNLIYQSDGCTVGGAYATADPLLGSFSADNGYFPLLHGSPAIDTGNPATPGTAADVCKTVDQLATSRPIDGDGDTVAVCDMGAYEADSAVAGISPIANTIYINGGSLQTSPVSTAFTTPLSILVKDQFDAPLAGITVTFTAPASDASGTFGDSGTATTTAITDSNGLATAAAFTANSLLGDYTINATVSGAAKAVQFYLSNSGHLLLYAAPTGSDANSCLSPAAPCLTISGALYKTWTGDDTIKVATGTYSKIVIDTNVTLLGGWNSDFTQQNGMSTIDGQSNFIGIHINSSNAVATIERFVIKHGSQGIANTGHLTLNNSIVTNNITLNSFGGGIYNSGTLIIHNSTISNNKASEGGGIYNGGTLTTENSTISSNTAHGFDGGGISNSGTLTIENSTIRSNTAYYGGGGIQNGGTFTINNSTISENTATYGGGIYNDYGDTALLNNTILAKNGPSVGSNSENPDCIGTVTSGGYNLIGDTTGCTFNATTGDLINTDPKLGPFIMGPTLGYYSLLTGSPAIDAGNPATPGSGSGACLATDQRGLTRPFGAHCDMGAYEYASAGSAAKIMTMDGTPQRTGPHAQFFAPLKAIVLDAQGSPVSGATVTFTAPASGASGIFSGSGTRMATAITDSVGIATAPTFTANGTTGSYLVSATVTGAATPASFSLTNLAWFVATTGNDANTCASASAPCKTINAAIGKAIANDVILVAAGTYTGTGSNVVSINKSVKLLGGWNTGFTIQNSKSIIDGQKARRDIYLNGQNALISILIDRFIIQNGSSPDGGGINNNHATLTLSNSIVKSNTSSGAGSLGNGGGINNDGMITINNSIITGNTANYDGGGIYNSPYYQNGSVVILNNSTVSANSAAYDGAGIYNDAYLTLNSSTVSNNITKSIYQAGIHDSGGTTTLNNSTVSGHSENGISQTFATIIINNSTISGNKTGISTEPGYSGTITLQNSIVAGNTHDCAGPITSAGYNLIGSTTGCQFTASTGDLTNINAKLGQLIGLPGYVPLLFGSPAINAGNPATCPAVDERKLARPQGGRCDMGSYEFKMAGTAVSIGYVGGSGQNSSVGGIYPTRLQAYLVDSLGSPVSGVAVTFTAPATGASGVFASTHTRTATVNTNSMGIAIAPQFTANNTPGSYTVTASAGGISGSVAFTLNILPVPVIISPTGTILDATPTYQWKKVTGATKYQYQLWKGSTLVYTKITSTSICGVAVCADTPVTTLGFGSYRWKVQAMLNNTWQAYSAFQLFNLPIMPKAGFWKNAEMSFYVSPNQTQVKNFTIYVTLAACGTQQFKITSPLTLPVTNHAFFLGAVGDTFYATGTFDSETSAHGAFELYNYPLAGCGLVGLEPVNWTATWQNGTQPTP